MVIVLSENRDYVLLIVASRKPFATLGSFLYGL